MASESFPPTRRVVTGHDEHGKSKVLYDDHNGAARNFPNGSRLETLWFTEELPVDCSSKTDSDPVKVQQLDRNPKGSTCGIVWMRPEATAPMHRTGTIDYSILLEGEIELKLDNGETRLLRAGDIIVQRETMHSWHNPHSTKWAKMMFVMIKAKETGA